MGSSLAVLWVWGCALCFFQAQGAASARALRIVWLKSRIKKRINKREEGRGQKIVGLVGCSMESESILVSEVFKQRWDMTQIFLWKKHRREE